MQSALLNPNDVNHTPPLFLPGRKHATPPPPPTFQTHPTNLYCFPKNANLPTSQPTATQTPPPSYPAAKQSPSPLAGDPPPPPPALLAPNSPNGPPPAS